MAVHLGGWGHDVAAGPGERSRLLGNGCRQVAGMVALGSGCSGWAWVG